MRQRLNVFCECCTWVIVVTVLVFVGCDESRTITPVDVDIVTPEVIVAPELNTATAIHKQSARKRAEIYENLAKAAEMGTIKTLKDAETFSNPMFEQSSQDYKESTNALRRSRLHDPLVDLPPDAPQVFRLFAKEYREAGK